MRVLPTVLLAAAALSVSIVAAEDMPLFDPGALDMPIESLPAPDAGGASQGTSAGQTEQLLVMGPAESLDGCEPAPYDLWDPQSVPAVSSGTWVRRGMWYAEADVVVMTRLWERDSITLASEDGGLPLPGRSGSNRFLILHDAHPGEDSSVRTTLGRFLFRDERNRDHTAELTIFGGGDWVQEGALDSEDGFLVVPFETGGSNRSFTGADRMEYIYRSRFTDFELNYRVKQRMGRDQMVMEPNGHWRRQASSGMSKEFLIGVRFMEVIDVFDWLAEDIGAVGDDGAYLISANNDLIGLQLGGGFTYETSRWSVGLSGKMGAYVNDVSSRSTLNFTADDIDDFDRKLAADELSFIGDFSVLAKWHLTPNFSLRMGLQGMLISSVALAPNQINFITETKDLVVSGDPFYYGTSVGFEGYW